MTDQLPTITGDRGGVETVPVILVNPDATTYTTGGEKSEGNSTNTPLGGTEEFTGAWEVNDKEHACVNVLADADGTLIVEFAIVKDDVDITGPITDSDVVVTASLPRLVYAGTPYFRPLVKMAGRAIRVRYVNDSDAQSEFNLLTSYGNNLFPASSTDDNELLVTVDEQERDSFIAYGFTNVADPTTSIYAVLIDLSDTTNFAHERTGRIDITNSYLSIDRDTNGAGFVRIGVITRIDGTDADITFFSGVTFEKSSDRAIIRDRKYSPSQIKCGVVDGSTNRIVSAFQQTNVTAVNTGLTLDSAAGSVTPGVGDVIIAVGRTAGSFNASVSATYHSDTTP